jgi:hypothetical protein
MILPTLFCQFSLAVRQRLEFWRQQEGKLGMPHFCLCVAGVDEERRPLGITD